MSKKLEISLFILVLLVAVFLSSYCLKTSPPFWFDEGTFYQVVNNLAFQGVSGVQLAPGIFSDLSLISLGYPVFYPAAGIFRLFGASLLVERGIAVFFLLGLVSVSYFLVRKWYGARAALITLGLMVTFAPLYGNGKSFLGEVPGLFFLIAGVLILSYLPRLSKNNFWLSLLAGIVLGMAVSVKPSYLPLLPALAVGLAVNWRVFFTTRKGRETLIAGVVGLLAAMVIWVLTQFDTSASVARIFKHYSNPYYVSDWLSVILLNLKRFFIESTPLHSFLLLIVAAWFFVKRFWKKEVISTGEIVIFVFALLTFAAYLRTVGWYRYFFPAHFILFLFFVPALESALDTLFKSGKQKIFWFWIVISALFLAQLIPLSKNTLSCNIDAPSSVEPYFQSLGVGEKVLFYSLPQLAARYPRFDFYQYIRMSEQLQLGKENIALIGSGFFDVIFIEEAKKEEVSQYSAYHLEQNIFGISIYRKTSKK